MADSRDSTENITCLSILYLIFAIFFKYILHTGPLRSIYSVGVGVFWWSLLSKEHNSFYQTLSDFTPVSSLCEATTFDFEGSKVRRILIRQDGSEVKEGEQKSKTAAPSLVVRVRVMYSHPCQTETDAPVGNMFELSNSKDRILLLFMLSEYESVSQNFHKPIRTFDMMTLFKQTTIDILWNMTTRSPNIALQTKLSLVLTL